jgi:hypothetical protein
MLDEFQAVADLSPRLPELLKALSDEHPKVSLILAGSRKHLMENLVLAQGAPLYNMAERLALGPIEDAAMNQYLRSRARSGGKTITPAVAAAICDLSGPIPHDIQRLAYEVFDESGHKITQDSVEVGMSRVVEHEAEGYADRFAKYALGQRRVLMVLATHEVIHPQSAEFTRLAGYANPGAARKAISVLEDDETVLYRSGVYEVADPFFREWLRQGR